MEYIVMYGTWFDCMLSYCIMLNSRKTGLTGVEGNIKPILLFLGETPTLADKETGRLDEWYTGRLGYRESVCLGY